jgi:hypothetical protein
MQPHTPTLQCREVDRGGAMKRFMAELARLLGDHILRRACLAPEDVARLDALAKERGVSRAQMLLTVIGSGLGRGGHGGGTGPGRLACFVRLGITFAGWRRG